MGHEVMHPDSKELAIGLVLLALPGGVKEVLALRGVRLARGAEPHGLEMHGGRVDRERRRDRVDGAERERGLYFKSKALPPGRDAHGILHVDDFVDLLEDGVAVSELVGELLDELEAPRRAALGVGP